MTTYNTGNPLGSTDPRDLYDNAEGLDLAINSDKPTFKGRLGKEMLTIRGLSSSATGDPSIAIAASQKALDEANRAKVISDTMEDSIVSAADSAAIEAVSNVVDAVSGYTEQAELYANESKLARDAALSSGKIFSTSAAGQSSSLASGDYFWVINGDHNELWKKGASSPSKTDVTSASATVVGELNKTVSSCFYTTRYNNSDLLPFIEESVEPSTDFYMKINENIRIVRLGEANVLATWGQIKAQVNMPELFVTSPGGVPDSLKLVDQSLVYDKSQSKFSVVSRGQYNPVEHILIAMSVFGQLIGGLLLESHNKARLSYLKQKLDAANKAISSQFYLADSNKLSGKPVVEQALYSSTRPYNLYIKFGALRLRSLNEPTTLASWEQIKTDVDDPLRYRVSPSGVADCLLLSDECLVYDMLAERFKVIGISESDSSKYINIATATFGQLSSGLLYNSWSSTEISSIKSSPAILSKRYSPERLLVAHAGLNGGERLAPSNSLLAYELAGEYGYWGAETDIRETADGEWILMHDATVDRTTYSTGAVSSLTYDEIKVMDCSRLSSVSSDNPVPSLRDYLNVCSTYGMVPLMEIKTTPTAAGVDKILQEISVTVGVTNAIIMTFDSNVLDMIRERNPSVALGLLCNAVQKSHVDKALDIGNCALVVQSTSARENVDLAIRSGLVLGMWTLSQQEIDNSKTDGVKFLITNDGLTYDKGRGDLVSSFSGKGSFADFTDISQASISSGYLIIPAGKTAYIDVPADRGDLLNLRLTCKKTGAEASISPTITMATKRPLGVAGRSITSIDIEDTYSSPIFASAIATDLETESVRISFTGSVDSGISIKSALIERRKIST